MIIILRLNHNLVMVNYYYISSFAKIATRAQFITLINTFTFELDHTKFTANR
ncbi:hypothetical protein HMPREF0693_0970 [Proteus mirabilis ATCC 29906]|uniref:Uncharacterized protein n=1 Tax=Proteus mirabilis (strain HI4320) TaxID=529507 RepID=B4EWM8_PROMH|nr:hypothetical protein HMPREF0693_0970 [Proteus mirabilis ATCC 29906]CAR42953.1 hypothetical protein PMI1398 [Proteus mirabilis HI4320]